MDSRWLIFGAMLLGSGYGLFYKRYPIGFALIIGAVVSSLVAGKGLPVRHLVEGAFTYFDPMLIIFTAMLFMKVQEAQGVLKNLALILFQTLGRHPLLLGVGLTLFIMIPAMLTGITATSLLTTGAVIIPLFISAGMPPPKAGALVGFISVMGMIAPPINLLVMMMGQGVDMPYIGFTLPLAILSFPLSLLAMLWWGRPYLSRLTHQQPRSASFPSDLGTSPDIKPIAFLPLFLIFLWMILIRALSSVLPDVGIPFIFFLGTLLSLILGKRVSIGDVFYQASLQALPILSLLVGVGGLIQVMTLTGVRGLLVGTALGLPNWSIWAGLTLLLPLFGGVSAFAAAMVFGIPLLLALLGSNAIAVCAGLSLLVGIGDLLPPTGINARLAAEMIGEPRWLKITSSALPLLAAASIWGTIFIGLSYLGVIK